MRAQSRFLPPQRVAACDHGIVYRNDREFCGWPFYCGLWRVPGGDVVAGFKKIPAAYAGDSEISHTRLTVGQGQLVLIRSRDGGASWDPASQEVVFDLADDAQRILREGGESYAGEPPLDLRDPNVLVMAGALPALLKPNSRAWIRLSADGGRTFRKPILLPLCGLPNVTGHGPPTVRQDGMGLLGLSTTSADGWTNRPLVYASPDGTDWRFLSFVTPAIEGGSAVSDRTGPIIFGALRHFYTRLLALRDGRIVCVYGYRLPPFGVRARVSEDDGRTWGREMILRDDGGSWDLGYPRVTECAPGELLAVYYMNCRDDPIQMNGGVRHIAQTTFTLD